MKEAITFKQTFLENLLIVYLYSMDKSTLMSLGRDARRTRTLIRSPVLVLELVLQLIGTFGQELVLYNFPWVVLYTE